MNALILAGGFGTRLGKVGESTPKGLIASGSSSLFDRLINDLLILNDVNNIAVVSNNCFTSQYKKHLLRYPKQKIQVINNGVSTPDKRRGALGDILFALDELKWWRSDLFVLVSDTYYRFNLADEVKLFKKCKSFTTVVRRFNDVSHIENRLGCAVMRGDRIVNFVEKPQKAPSLYAAIPFYIYPSSILPMLKLYRQDKNNMDAPGSIIPYLLKKSIPVFALETDEATLDVGTTSDIDTLQIIAKDDKK